MLLLLLWLFLLLLLLLLWSLLLWVVVALAAVVGFVGVGLLLCVCPSVGRSVCLSGPISYVHGAMC